LPRNVRGGKLGSVFRADLRPTMRGEKKGLGLIVGDTRRQRERDLRVRKSGSNG